MSNDHHEHGEDASFADILHEFEKSSDAAPTAKGKGKGKRKSTAAAPLRGTVVGVSGDFVLVDYGAKAEGVIPSSDLIDAAGNLAVKRGDTIDVAITGY